MVIIVKRLILCVHAKDIGVKYTKSYHSFSILYSTKIEITKDILPWKIQKTAFSENVFLTIIQKRPQN